MTATDEVVRSVSLTAPSSGVVIVNSTASATEVVGGRGVRCSITTEATVDTNFLRLWESPGDPGKSAQLAGTRGFNVSAGEFTVNLVCDHFGGSASTIFDSALTAIFIPGS